MIIEDLDSTIFRGKSKKTGEWAKGGFHYHQLFTKSPGEGVKPSDMEAVIIQSGFSDWHLPKPIEFIAVVPETVGQFIGLSDMTGEMAFTGDIVIDEHGRKWVIFNCSGGFGICRTDEWKNRNKSCVFLFEGLSDAQNSGWFKSTNRIIGNIFDNPEYLD